MFDDVHFFLAFFISQIYCPNILFGLAKIVHVVVVVHTLKSSVISVMVSIDLNFRLPPITCFVR